MTYNVFSGTLNPTHSLTLASGIPSLDVTGSDQRPPEVPPAEDESSDLCQQPLNVPSAAVESGDVSQQAPDIPPVDIVGNDLRQQPLGDPSVDSDPLVEVESTNADQMSPQIPAVLLSCSDLIQKSVSLPHLEVFNRKRLRIAEISYPIRKSGSRNRMMMSEL